MSSTDVTCEECGQPVDKDAALAHQHPVDLDRPIGEAFNDPRVPCCGRDAADCDCDIGIVAGERVKILGPKPDNWDGLGATLTDAVLVEYPPTASTPDGEIGAVSRCNIHPEGET